VYSVILMANKPSKVWGYY